MAAAPPFLGPLWGTFLNAELAAFGGLCLPGGRFVL
jgi:hypothetical protein